MNTSESNCSFSRPTVCRWWSWSVSTRIKGLSQCLDFARLIKLNLHFWNLNRQVMIIKFKLSALSFKLCHLKNKVKFKKKDLFNCLWENTDRLTGTRRYALIFRSLLKVQLIRPIFFFYFIQHLLYFYTLFYKCIPPHSQGTLWMRGNIVLTYYWLDRTWYS